MAAKYNRPTPNPKDLIGSRKVSCSKLPDVAVLWGSMAMGDGAEKYGPFNWRDFAVQATVYLDAIDRHLKQWRSGEELADDSLVHHLGHVIGCCAILLDAQATGMLIDDRPKSPAVCELLKRLNAQIAALDAKGRGHKVR